MGPGSLVGSQHGLAPLGDLLGRGVGVVHLPETRGRCGSIWALSRSGFALQVDQSLPARARPQQADRRTASPCPGMTRRAADAASRSRAAAVSSNTASGRRSRDRVGRKPFSHSASPETSTPSLRKASPPRAWPARLDGQPLLDLRPQRRRPASTVRVTAKPRQDLAGDAQPQHVFVPGPRRFGRPRGWASTSQPCSSTSADTPPA